MLTTYRMRFVLSLVSIAILVPISVRALEGALGGNPDSSAYGDWGGGDDNDDGGGYDAPDGSKGNESYGGGGKDYSGNGGQDSPSESGPGPGGGMTGGDGQSGGGNPGYGGPDGPKGEESYGGGDGQSGNNSGSYDRAGKDTAFDTFSGVDALGANNDRSGSTPVAAITAMFDSVAGIVASLFGTEPDYDEGLALDDVDNAVMPQSSQARAFDQQAFNAMTAKSFATPNEKASQAINQGFTFTDSQGNTVVTDPISGTSEVFDGNTSLGYLSGPETVEAMMLAAEQQDSIDSRVESAFGVQNSYTDPNLNVDDVVSAATTQNQREVTIPLSALAPTSLHTTPQTLTAPTVTQALFVDKSLANVTLTEAKNYTVINVPAQTVPSFVVYDTAKITLDPATHSFVPDTEYTKPSTAAFVDVIDDLKAILPTGTGIYADHYGLPVMSPGELAIIGKFDLTQGGKYNLEKEKEALDDGVRAEIGKNTRENLLAGKLSPEDLAEVTAITIALVNRAVAQKTSIEKQVNSPAAISSVTVDGKSKSTASMLSVIDNVVNGSYAKTYGLDSIVDDNLAFATHYYSPKGIEAQTNGARSTPAGWDIDFSMQHAWTEDGHIFGNVVPASGKGHEYSILGKEIALTTAVPPTSVAYETASTEAEEADVNTSRETFSFVDNLGREITVNPDGTGTARNLDLSETNLSAYDVSVAYLGEGYTSPADENPSTDESGSPDATTPSNTPTAEPETQSPTTVPEAIADAIAQVPDVMRDIFSSAVDAVLDLFIDTDGEAPYVNLDEVKPPKKTLADITDISVHFWLDVACPSTVGGQFGYIYTTTLTDGQVLERAGCGFGTPATFAREIARDLEETQHFATLDVEALFNKITFRFYHQKP